MMLFWRKLIFSIAALFFFQLPDDPVSASELSTRDLLIEKSNFEIPYLKGKIKFTMWSPRAELPSYTFVFISGFNGLFTSFFYEEFAEEIAKKGIQFIFVKGKILPPVKYKKRTAEFAFAVDYLKAQNIISDIGQTGFMAHSCGSQSLIEYYENQNFNLHSLVLLDPVDGPPDKSNMVIKGGKKYSNGTPLLIIESGLCSESALNINWWPACCPDGISAKHFFNAFSNPKSHIVIEEFGHTDMMNEGFGNVIEKTRFCKSTRYRERSSLQLYRRNMAEKIYGFSRSLNSTS